MTNNEALKPCPFCGEVPKTVTKTSMKIMDRIHTKYYILHICNENNYSTFPTIRINTVFLDTKKAAIAAWNKRVTEGK
jgi:Lar family restriction alleviation protein